MYGVQNVARTIWNGADGRSRIATGNTLVYVVGCRGYISAFASCVPFVPQFAELGIGTLTQAQKSGSTRYQLKRKFSVLIAFVLYRPKEILGP